MSVKARSPMKPLEGARREVFAEVQRERLFPGRILAVDDEEESLELVRQALAGERTEVFTATGIGDAAFTCGRYKCQLILLDLNLGTESGTALLRGLRSTGSDCAFVPIIMLSASADPGDSAACFDDGADDFVRKPFDPRDLVSRIRAVWRRCQPREGSSRLRVGRLALDFQTSTLFLSDRRVLLSPKECAILRALLGVPGRAVGRRELLSGIWGYLVDPRYKATTRTLQTHLDNLRKKMRPYEGLIQTLPGELLRIDIDLADCL